MYGALPERTACHHLLCLDKAATSRFTVSYILLVLLCVHYPKWLSTVLLNSGSEVWHSNKPNLNGTDICVTSRWVTMHHTVVI